MNTFSALERITNGLYGQAVADAVGNHFEFKNGIDYSDVISYANRVDKLIISDDTQMAIAGFEAIANIDWSDLYYDPWGADVGEIVDQAITQFGKSYIKWYDTQQKKFNTRIKKIKSVWDLKSMWSIQAPGNTCLSALRTLKDGGIVENDSNGCGSVMRLLPLAQLIVVEDLDITPYDAKRLARRSGGITHKHAENGTAIELFMDFVRYGIFEGIDYSKWDECEMLQHPYIDAIGEGWTALECVKMAIWAYHKANDFDDLLGLSIAHDGDSDSVAAIAGAFWGLAGKEVPEKYISKLDALDAIEYTIDKMLIV